MAGVLVDVLLKRLATLTLDKIERELKQEIKKLTKKLKNIRAVLEDAEQRQVMEANVKFWLNRLKDVAFDMDDMLDEWITGVEKHQLEKQEKEGANVVVATKKKVCFPFVPSSSCFRFGQVDYKLFLHHEVAKKIEELNERLALIDQNKQSFNFQTTTRAVYDVLPQRPKTTSLPNVKTFGRDFEKNLIITKLQSESSEGNEVPLIIPIVGLGGIGKTTLANLVYNDDKIKSHFDKKIWVCVSDPFEEIKIAKAIVECLGEDNISNELEHLMRRINESIWGKKFLLVLDDVWSPKLNQWEELIKPLRNGAMGSRVLVTTRNEEVATLMKAKTQMILLKGLSEAFCLSLFFHNADMNESSVREEFKDIGLKLVKRCDGLPLAAKTLGSLMRNKKTIREWNAVLDSETWKLKLKEMQQDVFRPLLLSYHDLTPTIKQCLLYCVIFPKDYVYDRSKLIELWMSQDYLNAEKSENMMIVGQSYFDHLVMRSFFQDIIHSNWWDDGGYDEWGYGNVRCKIRGIVHDFLQYLNEDAIKHLEFDGNEGKEVTNDKVHHLTFAHASDSFSNSLLSYNRLRTLIAIIDDEPIQSGQLLFELIIQLKNLRTLTFPHFDWLESLPDKIGELIHLRYLDLSGNVNLKELPSAMGSLYNLQTLRLVGCRRLKEIDVRRLINLRHLHVQHCLSLRSIKGIEKLRDLHTLRLVRCYLLEEIDVRRLINLRHLHVRDCLQLRSIKGIEKLRDLQTLDEFRVWDDQGNKLEDLKDLNQLQGSLTILIQGNPKMADNAAILVNKPHLLQLNLHFNSFDREIMNGLEPYRALESLHIGDYGGSAFSDWLSSLHSLRVLTLRWCTNCEMLPPLGKLASLESLTIDCLDGVSKVGVEFLGANTSSSTSSSFPKLKQLTISDMVSWEEWEGVNSENITIMPCLSHLTILYCYDLKALPDFLWNTPLQKLEIRWSPILERLYREETGEQRAKISRIPNTILG